MSGDVTNNLHLPWTVAGNVYEAFKLRPTRPQTRLEHANVVRSAHSITAVVGLQCPFYGVPEHDVSRDLPAGVGFPRDKPAVLGEHDKIDTAWIYTRIRPYVTLCTWKLLQARFTP
jgi:hypothetical protein